MLMQQVHMAFAEKEEKSCCRAKRRPQWLLQLFILSCYLHSSVENCNKASSIMCSKKAAWLTTLQQC